MKEVTYLGVFSCNQVREASVTALSVITTADNILGKNVLVMVKWLSKKKHLFAGIYQAGIKRKYILNIMLNVDDVLNQQKKK